MHLFWKVPRAFERSAIAIAEGAVAACRADEHQVVTFATLGHKADLITMALGPDLWRLRRLQADLVHAGLELVDSYVSMTEVSEYAKGMPEQMLQARLYPTLPPEGMRAVCFYPMSKRRGIGKDDHNWFSMPYEDRDRLMREHGTTGRTFHGRVVQLITGSTGLDDHEWAVTLFAHDPGDLKHVVYKMRFDEASAVFAEFGEFVTGMVDDIGVVLRLVARGPSGE